MARKAAAVAEATSEDGGVPAAPDADEPEVQPPAEPAEAPETESPETEGDEPAEEPPAPSALARLKAQNRAILDDAETSDDDKRALLGELWDDVPEEYRPGVQEQRTKEQAEREERDQQGREAQRRAVLVQTEQKSTQAKQNILGHQKAVAKSWADFRGGERESPDDFDADAVDAEIEDLREAERILGGHEMRAATMAALAEAFDQAGGDLSEDEIRAVAQESDGTLMGVMRGYFQKLGARHEARGIEKGKAEAMKEADRKTKAELAAQRTELERQIEGEPDAGKGKLAEPQGDHAARMMRLAYGRDAQGKSSPATDADRKWFSERYTA